MCSLQVGGVMGLWAHVALYNNGSGKACKLSSLPWPWGLMSSQQGYELKTPNTLCRALLANECSLLMGFAKVVLPDEGEVLELGVLSLMFLLVALRFGHY